MEILAKRLLELRQERKLTRKMLADFYGVSVDYLVGRTDERA